MITNARWLNNKIQYADMHEHKIRRAEITIETHSVTTIRSKVPSQTFYCEHCRESVTTFAPEQLAELLQLDLTEISRRIETHQIHLANDGRGAALICSNSLTYLEKERRIKC
jgi:uncharacterized protein (DUF2344 family)